MGASFTGIEDLRASLQKELAEFTTQCVDETKNAARVLTEEMMSRTPVWSGETVRNYAWGADGAPAGGQIEAEGGPGGGRDTDGTGFMGIGEEPRRAANESAALADMENVLAGVTELKTLSVANHSDIWDLVDNGTAPTPDRARNPGGVSILAEQATKDQLGDKFK